MTGSTAIVLKKKSLLQPVNLIAAGYVLVLLLALQKYLASQSVNFLLGLATLPFACRPDAGKKGNYRYGLLAAAWMVLCFLMPVKTLLYFSIAFSLLFFIESFYGKTGLLALLVVFLACPVFQYLVDIFSFPIRMELTKIAGSLLNFLGSEAEVKGNTIIHSRQEFTVDPACMGLSMMIASFLSGIMLAGFYQARYKREMSGWLILLYLAVILLLNIFANLFRIVFVVQFDIRQETLSHDIVGLGCLLGYVLIPAVCLANVLVRKAAIKKADSGPSTGFSRRLMVAHLVIFGCIVLLATRVFSTDTFTVFKIPSAIKGYSVYQYAPGIVKLEKSGVLIYVKYIRGFYDTEHNPMICWSGEGYQFKNVAIESISNRNVFTATIANGNDKLYSAWWYDNGIKNTTKQLEWRWDLLTGANHYVLVNISCLTKEDLKKEIQKIVRERTLQPFHQP